MLSNLRRPLAFMAWGRACCVLLVVVLAGCSTMTESRLATSALSPGKGRIILTRTNETLRATTLATAKVNGHKVADVAAGSTVAVDVPPGPLSLSVEAWNYPGHYAIPLQITAGQTLKVEISPREPAAAGVLGPIGGLMEANAQGKGGGFTVREVANLDAIGANAPESGQLNLPPAKTETH